MKKLCEELNVDSSIKTVPYDDMLKNIKYIFKNDKYKFYLNSELIDVNNRFRIFKYQNKNYIVKKTTKENGNLEIKYAHIAEKNIDGLKVDGYTIKIIKSKIYNIGKYGYILTEYMGNTLQEYNYIPNKQLTLKINTIFKIIDLFLEKGFLYRGFIPRNIIIKNKRIYLLDWEDVIFNPNAPSKVNLLWKTNFISNWSYFYEYKKLEKYINKYKIMSNNEPQLLKYEEKFQRIANLNCNIVKLRKFILKTVVESEKKIKDETLDFIISPNDMAHLVSDIFNSDIDVLFDICSAVLRSKSEKKYIEQLKILTSTIINAYNKNTNMQKNVIKEILKFIYLSSQKESKINEESTIVELFENDKEAFLRELKEVLNKVLFAFNRQYLNNDDFTRISEYIYSFR